jgi:hypothetical protein
VNTTTNHRIDRERGKVREGASAREKRASAREKRASARERVREKRASARLPRPTFKMKHFSKFQTDSL